MASTLAGHVVAPGDTVLHLPEDGVVRASRGIQRTGQELRSTHAGLLHDVKGSLLVSAATRRYIPVAGDLVIGYIKGVFAEEFRVDIRAPTAAVLPALAFEGATKRNRPRLAPGDAVYARVAETSRDMEPELTCVDAAGKAAGLGPLEGGFVLETDTAHCRRLMAQPPPAELAALGATLAFELAVGANGRVLVHSQAPGVTAVVAQALLACARLPVDESHATVERLLASSDDRMQEG